MAKVIDIAKKRMSPSHISYELPTFFKVKKTKKKTSYRSVAQTSKSSNGGISLQTIHLICGVPGSGKTWIAKQLDQYNWVPHDEHIGKDKDYVSALISEAKKSSKPILAEAPFLTRKLIGELRERGAEVVAYHIDEPPAVIKQRYEQDRKKPFPQRYVTLLKNRCSSQDWDHEGTSRQILDILKEAQSEKRQA